MLQMEFHQQSILAFIENNLFATMITAQKASRGAQGGQGKSFKTSKSMATKFEPPTHPAIIITSAFTAPHIEKLKKKLEENYIAYGMQTSKKKVNRPPGAPADKNFIVVDDSQGPQVLEGEFLGLNMCRVDYPKKNNLDDVIQKFQKYIGLGKETVQQHQDYQENAFNNWQEQEQMQKVGKTLNKGKNGNKIAGGFSGQGNFLHDQLKLEKIQNILEIKEKAEQFRDVFNKKGKSKSRCGSSNKSSNSKGKKSKKKSKNENLQNSKENKGIVLKSVGKFGEVGESVDAEKRALFILKTEKQSINYRQYVQKFQNVKNKRIMVIRSLQDYYKNCYAQGEGQNCLLLSPNVAFKELHKFRNLKDVYIYGNDPKFCAQLVKGNIKKAAFDSKEMDNILLSEGFNKDQLKDLIEPIRKVGSKMDLDQSDPKLSKKSKEKQKANEEDKQKKQKEKDKPSLFGRFVDFVKGKSKNKDKQKEKQNQKAKNKKQKSQSSSSSSSSERSSSESSEDKDENAKKGDELNQNNRKVNETEAKGQQKLKKNGPCEPQPDYLGIDNEQKKGLISLGQLLDHNNKEGDSQFARKKQPKITITRIKSNNKIPGEGTQKSSKDQNQNVYNTVKPIQPLKLSKQQNDKVNFQIPRPPEKELVATQPIKPRQKQQEDAMFQVPQKKQKQEQKGKYKVGGGIKRGSDQYKQLRFNLSKPVQSEKDINNFKVPKLEKGKRRQKQQTSSSSQSDNMIGGGKVPPAKKDKQRKKKAKKEKQNEEDINAYYQIKPPSPKPEQQRENKKMQHKVQDKGEESEQKYQVSNNIPQYLPSRGQESNRVKLMNNQKVAPAFCEQNPSQGQDAFQFGNNNYSNKRSQKLHNLKKKQSEDNFYYNPSGLQKQLSETVPNTRGKSRDLELSMTYPKVGKNNGKSPFERENAYNCYAPSNPNTNSYFNQQPKPQSQYQNHPNHPNHINFNNGNLQPNVSSQKPLNQPTNRNLYPTSPSGQPFILQDKQPFSQPLGHFENNTSNQPSTHNPYRLNSTRPIGPSNDNLSRPLSYSVHNPSTDFKLPFDQTKYDKTIENGVTVYRPKKIPFHLGVMPATVITQNPTNINPQIIVGKYEPIPSVPTYPISNSYQNPNLILKSRQSPNRPIIYSEQKPLRETASTYYQKIPVQAVSPTPNKKDTFSTYEYFMNNNELPIFSPASPHQKHKNPDRITPCKSVLVCDKPKQFDISQPVYQCDCKNKNNLKQKKRKPSWHQNDQDGKCNRKPRNTQKQNENFCHDCQNPTKLKKKMTQTKQAFYDMQSDESGYRQLSNFKTRPRNAKSLSKSAQQPFNSSILDNISSRVQKPERSNKNFTVLYLVNSNLNPKLMKQLFEISDQSDTIQTFPYSHPDKIVDLAKKGQNVFDFVIVLGGSNADKIAFQNVQLGTCKGVYYVIYDSDAIQSSVSEHNITLRILTDLTIILNGMFNNKFIDFDSNTSKSHKIGYIYFKDFNFPIRRMAKMLKAQYPNCQVRRYFGLLDLPTKLPNIRNETTIILLDQVSFNQMSSYCSQQEKQNPNILKICIPKSRQAMKLCQKSPASQKIVWLTEEELDNWEFLVKRIQKRIR